MPTPKKILKYLLKGLISSSLISAGTFFPVYFVSDDMSLADILSVNLFLIPCLTVVMAFVLIVCDYRILRIKERNKWLWRERKQKRDPFNYDPRNHGI